MTAPPPLWIDDNLDVPRETIERLRELLAIVLEENERQNLISRGSIGEAWTRHVIDSAQLMRFVPDGARSWIDFGTGAGFPGMVAAILFDGTVTLVEERRLRAEFLQRTVDRLGLQDRTKVFGDKLERVEPHGYDVISARAFAPLDRLLTLGMTFSTNQTRWILPKGRNARSELDAARGSWQGDFRLEGSVTDPEAWIIVADAVAPVTKGRARR